MTFWKLLIDWCYELGAQYGVDPLVFGCIYLGTTPFFLLSLAWMVRNMRQDRPIILPASATSFSFMSAYVYLLIVGRNLPLWVYGAMMLTIAYSAYAMVGQLRKGVADEAKC